MIKSFANFLLVSSVFLLFFSCKEISKEIPTEQLLQDIIETETQLSDKNSEKALSQEEKIAFWKNKLKKDKYDSNRVAKARINYIMGKNFVPINIDSAEIYTTKAFILIEDVEGFEKEKIFIYNSLGTIASSKGKNFLVSFYFSKIVSILDANPSISTISIKDKIEFYLHSVQTNAHIGLYQSAFELTKKAERYVDSIPKGHDLRFRVYALLFSSSYDTKTNADSLSYYLEKMEQHTHSVKNNKASWFQNTRLCYLYKAHILRLNNQFDSARIYYQKTLEIDKNAGTEVVIKLENTYLAYCYLLQNSIETGKLSEADSIISKISEIKKDTSLYLSKSQNLTFWVGIMNYHYKFRNFNKYHEATKTVLSLKDQIQKEAELQAKEEMHTIYQLEENKKSIKELNQSVGITENKLPKATFFLITLKKKILLTITVLAVLIILAILAILYYRQKSRKLQQEYEKVVLEQKLLRTQMAPHFIFNTLSTLQSLIRFQEPQKAIDYLNLFSRLLRSNLELSRQDTVSLEDEIETIHNYLNLQQIRFKDYFTYQIQIPDELEIDALFIPPMLIQPFVENCILHGFDGEGEWRIDIKITELTATNQLQIEIIDNGLGIHTAPKKKHKSLSGDIAKERLEILSKKYKILADYQIFSEKGKGTTVCLKLPIINELQQN